MDTRIEWNFSKYFNSSLSRFMPFVWMTNYAQIAQIFAREKVSRLINIAKIGFLLRVCIFCCRNDIINSQDHGCCLGSRTDRLGLNTKRFNNAGFKHIYRFTLEYIQTYGLISLLMLAPEFNKHINSIKSCILCKGLGDYLKCLGKFTDSKLFSSLKRGRIFPEAKCQFDFRCAAACEYFPIFYYYTDNPEGVMHCTGKAHNNMF